MEKYIVTIASTREPLDPVVLLFSEEKAKEYFENFIKERDNDDYLVKQITTTRVGNHLSATVLKNHKGWGHDYFCKITVERFTI